MIQKLRLTADQMLRHALQHPVSVLVHGIPDPSHGLGTFTVRTALIAFSCVGMELQQTAGKLLLCLPAGIRVAMASLALFLTAD